MVSQPSAGIIFSFKMTSSASICGQAADLAFTGFLKSVYAVSSIMQALVSNIDQNLSHTGSQTITAYNLKA